MTNFQTDSDDAGQRLDIFLGKKISDKSRSHIQKIISDGKVKVDGRNVKPSYKLNGGENISVEEVDAVDIE